MPGAGIGVHEGLGVTVLARAAALDHVRRERERRARKADQRHPSGEPLAYEPHRLEDVAERFLDGHPRERVDVGARPDRTGGSRDRRPSRTRARRPWAPARGECPRRGSPRRPESARSASSSPRRRAPASCRARGTRAAPGARDTRQVSPGLTHDPDRRAVGRFATAGAEKSRSGGHRDGQCQARPVASRSVPVSAAWRRGAPARRGASRRRAVPSSDDSARNRPRSPRRASAALQTGPIDLTAARANPGASAARAPCRSATCTRCVTCVALVKSATSRAPAPMRSIAVTRGARSSGSAQR